MTSEQEIAEAFSNPRELKPALDRWTRSKKNWADRGMLVNAILEHFTGTTVADSEDRITVFHAAKRAAAKAP